MEHPYQFIQYGIDNASDGDTVYVYSGTYYENILVYKSITLLGEDRNNAVIDGQGIRHVVQIDKKSVLLSNFTIENSGNESWGIDVHVRHNSTNSIKDVHITNCIVTDCVGGILLKDIATISVNNCVIYNNTGLSIYVLDSANISLHTCTVFNNGEEIGDGWIHPGSIQIEGENREASNIRINDCHIYNNIGHGIHIFKAKDSEIYLNNIHINSWSGVICEFVKNIKIYGNNIYGNADAGILVYGKSCSNIEIFHNVITGKSNRISRNGIILKDCSNCVSIKNNNVSLNNKSGVYLLRSSGNCIIQNNLSQNNGHGICLSSSSNNTILNNIIYCNKPFGMSFYDSEGNHVSSNHITSNHMGGIILTSSPDNNISRNTIANNEFGIFLSGSEENHVSSNNIISNYRKGIYIEYFSKDNVITNNNFQRNQENAADICDNRWDSNYWDNWIGLRIRLLKFLPYHIPGTIFTNFDRHPAREPYDIP
jgi:parallel beta-helix repeat protein